MSAPSGAGKSSLIDSILKRFNLDDSLRLSVSHTTRQPRPGEVDHVSYHFVTNEEFEALIARGAFYEYAHVFDHYYGTSKEIVEQWLNEGKDVILDIEQQGALQIKKKRPDALLLFVMPPSVDEVYNRLKKRGTENEETIMKRMKQGARESEVIEKYDFLVINDDLDRCVREVHNTIQSAKYATSRNADKIAGVVREFREFLSKHGE